MKNQIKWGDKKARVRYSKGPYTKESGLPEGTISIYSKDYGVPLPKALNPTNDTNMMTDYFETDRVRIKPDNKHYNDVLKLIKD